MGDRALIIFKKGADISPIVYLHWAGCHVTDYIVELASLAGGQAMAADYAAARFIGIAHQANPGTLSLGVQQTPPELVEAICKSNAKVIAEYSHGDAGLVIVDASDFSWIAYDGYLAESVDRDMEKAT